MAFQSTMDAHGSTFNETHRDQIITTIHGDIHGGFRGDKPDLHSLLSPVPDAAYNRGGRVARCQDGTREELIAMIKRWVDKGGAQSICWLNGPAGSGKSAVSQTFAEWCAAKDILAASFFFLRGAGNRSKIAHFISSLAYQLSVSMPATKKLIERVLQSERSILRSSFKHQFMKLVIEPILAVRNPILATISRKKPHIIVIDALDECDDKTSTAEFVESVIELFQEKRHPIRVFFTSRVEEHLRKKLVTPIIHPLALQDFDARLDIRKFFQSRFSTIYKENQTMRSIPLPWPSNADLETLVQKSDGSFIFADTLVKYIDDGTEIPHRKIKKALMANAGLDTLYNQVLSAAPRSDKFQLVIGTIMLLGRPLSITLVAHLLQLQTADILHALLGVQSILLIPGDDDQHVQLFHTSLRDFFTSKPRSGEFFIDPPKCHVLIATNCLKSLMILSEDILFPGEPQTYACRYWCHHINESIEDGVANLYDSHFDIFLMEFMSQAFEKWINSLIMYNQLGESMDVLSSLMLKLKHLNMGPQHLLDLLEDIQRQTRV